MKKPILFFTFSFFLISFLTAQTPASNIQFSNIGTNSFTVSWTSGGGAGRIVVVRASSSSHVYPSDGSNYTPSSGFGFGSNLGSSNYVVYEGGGSLVTVSNLLSNTSYSVYVYEYNNVPPFITYAYNTSSYAASGHATAITQPTVQASAIKLIQVGSDYAEISLTAGNGNYRIVTLTPGTANSNVPLDGFAYPYSTIYGSGAAIGSAYVVTNSTASTVKISGLAPNTSYTANAFEYNLGITGSQNYYTSSYPTRTFVTEPIAPPTSLSLTEVGPTSIRANWVKGDGANRIVTVKKGNVNTALNYDGVDDYVSVPHHANLKPTAEVTLELWAYNLAWSSAPVSTLAGCTQVGGYCINISGGTIMGQVRLNGAYSQPSYALANLNPGWHHFALTCDGRYTRLYVDGVEKSVIDALAVYPIQYSVNNNFIIGAEAGNGTTPDGPYFNGQIDEVRVWSNARGSVLINNVMNNTLDLVSNNYPNLMGYWNFDDAGVITPLTYNYPTAANTSTNTSGIDGLLTNFGSNYFNITSGSFNLASRWVYSGATLDCPIDATAYTANAVYGSGSSVSPNGYVVYSGNGNTINVTGLTPSTGYAFSVYEYSSTTGGHNYLTTVFASNGQRTTAADAVTPASALVFSNINPTSATATWTNGNGANRLVAVKPGRVRTALSFDGTDDHVNIPHNASQNAYPLTVTAWVKTTDTDGGIVNKYTVGSYNGYQIFVSGGNIYGWYFADNTNYIWPGVSPGDANGGPINDGKWHHVAYVVDVSGGKLYVDGTLRASNSWTGSPAVSTTSQPLYLGYYPSSWYLSGQVDEVTIYNTSFSQATLKSRMNKSLIGNEPNLVGYWKLDEGFSTSSITKNTTSTAGMDGTLTNFSSTAAATDFTSSSKWVLSSANVDMPQNNWYYSYNPIFLSGMQIGLPYYNVYNGSGNTVTVSNLSPNTYYNFAVYEYNATNGKFYFDENYATDPHLTGDVLTASVSPPSITAFTPSMGTVGTKVTITGANFGPTIADNTVYFGATKATVLSATSSQIEVIVPNGASFQPISVTANTLIGYSNKPFVVTQSCAGSINISSFGNGSTGVSDISLTTTGNNYVNAIGDLDLDGKPDLIVSNSTDRLSYFKNASVQNIISFNAKNDYFISSGTGPQGVAVHDMDGDGKLDVVVANQTTSTISIFKNSTQSPGFLYLPSRLDYVTASSPVSVITGDFDKDGKADVIVGYTGSPLSIFRNNSSIGSIQLATRIEIATYPLPADPAKIAAADIDGDGKLDLVVSLRLGNKISIFRNTSSGIGNIAFAAPVEYGIGVNATDVALGDLDNDGKIDVLIARSSGGVGVYRNASTSGAINLISMSTLTALANTPYSLAISDLDGDGKVDVALGYNSATSISVFKNQSTGTGNFNFAAKSDYTVPSGTPAHLAIADFNADSKSDIVVVSGTTAEPLFTNRINELSPEPTSASSNITFSAVAANSMTFSWTNGNGSNHLVVMKAASAVSQTPFDAVQYSPNPAFGSGTDIGGGNYVVYNSTGNSVTVTNLSSYTTYYVAIYEFNGSTACQLNYLVSPNTSGNQKTLNVPPTLTPISNPSGICQNSGLQTINLSGIGSGGETQTLSLTATSNNTTLIPNPSVTYISPNTTGSLSYTPNVNMSGSAVITVTVNDNAANNNTLVRTFTVTVTASPTTSSAGNNQQICTNQTNLGANSPLVGTGSWNMEYTNNGSLTNSNITNLTNPTSLISGLNVGDSVRLSWTIGNAPCANSVSYVSIKRKLCVIQADFTADKTSTCINSGDIITFTDNSYSATTISSWTWNFGLGATPATATGTTASPGSHQVTYTISSGLKTVTLDIQNTNSQSDNETKTFFIDVQPLPDAAGAINGSAIVCRNQSSVTYSVPAIANATSYSWNLPSGATISSGAGTNAIGVDFSNTAVSGTITVSGVHSCGNGTVSSSYSVTVNPLPNAAGIITGSSSVCEGATGITYSLSPVTNATSYSWTLPAGASITGGNNTNSITVSFASGTVSGIISVIPDNNCGAGQFSDISVTVNPLPVAAGTITGLSSITGCPSTNAVSYGLPVIDNASWYIWSVPSGASIVSGDSTNSVLVDFGPTAVSGSLEVYGKNSCGSGAKNSLSVNLNNLPDAAGTIVGEDTITICPTSKGITYAISPVFNATSYTWSLPLGATIASGNGTNVISVDFADSTLSGNVSVTPYNACGIGISSPPFSVYVEPRPSLDICLVTVDDLSQFNQVVWTKPNSPEIDSIRIYREKIGGYQVVKTLAATAYSMAIDSTSSPNNTYARYKLALVDTCGIESSLSDYHRTMFLQTNVGVGGVVNLNWSLYEGAPVLYYRIMRLVGSGSGSNMVAIDSVPGTNDLYTDNSIPSSGDTLYYAVDVIWSVTCNATFRKANPIGIMGPINTSRSNIKAMKRTEVGIWSINQKVLKDNLVIYPNPSKGFITMEYAVGYKEYVLEIYDMLGKVVYKEEYSEQDAIASTPFRSSKQINIENLQQGVYTLCLKAGNSLAYDRIIIE